jgi:tRNA(Ile)-lysidine synthase
MDLLHQFHRRCAAEQLVRPADRLLLAVSGGVDSCVILDLFCQLHEQWQLQLAVAHINHQLRGKASDDDEAFVRALAQEAGFPFYSQRVEIFSFAQTHKLSIETAARELRYQVLGNFCREWQARAVVTAHTQDDQAETILDHILRGCGLAGLAGMTAQSVLYLKGKSDFVAKDKNFAVSDDLLSSEDQPLKGQLRTKVLRPLLPFSRAEIEAYARSRQLQWREDHTNMDTQFRRNRIRHELLPLIKTRFNPQIAQSLEHLANIAVAAENYLQAEAEARLPEIIKERQSDKIILDLELFWKYFPIIRSYVVRAVMQRLVSPAEPTFSEMERILALLQKANNEHLAAGKRYIWRQQVEVLVDHDGVVFRKQKAKNKGQKANNFSGPVTIGERCEIPGTDLSILIERKNLPRDWRQLVNANSQFVDAEKVGSELRVRFPRPGDRFVPLRTQDQTEASRGAKKLSDFFTDLKVPLHRRQSVPILEGNGIIWICGYRIDNRFKITPATRSVLHLQLLSLRNHGSPA